MYAFTTQKALRAQFWLDYPNLDRRKITDHSGKGKMYKADARTAWTMYIDSLHRDGQISDALVVRACL